MAILGLAIASAALLWAYGASPSPLTPGQVLAMLPRGTTIQSLVRLEMDGRAPGEVAAVVRVPAFPGSTNVTFTSMVFRYDRWRRVYGVMYRATNPGSVPFSADAAGLVNGRDAAIFSGLHDDGTRSYRILGMVSGRATVLRERRFAGRLDLAEPLIIERGAEEPSAFQWTGGHWVQAEAPRVDGFPPTLTWHYGVRGGQVVARTSVVRLQRRQPLRIQPVGGGVTAVIVPDRRLDLVEAGYRHRMPGTYTIRVTTGLTPLNQAYTLIVIVKP